MRYSGNPTTNTNFNVTNGATFTLVGGATIKECLQTAGDGKYVELRNSGNSTGGSNNPRVRLNLFDIPGFTPGKLHGEMGIIKIRVLAWSKVSGTDIGTPRLNIFNECNPSINSPYNVLSDIAGDFTVGMAATELYLWTPITASYIAATTAQCLTIELNNGTSGGVGASYRVQLDYAAFEYGEASFSMDVVPTVFNTRVGAGVVAWVNPANSLVQDAIYATVGAGLTHTLDRNVPVFALPPGTILRGLDVIEYISGPANTAVDTAVMGLAHFPLSVPDSTTPVSQLFKNDNNIVNLLPAGATFITWGFGPDFNWAYSVIAKNGFAGLDPVRLFGAGYLMGSTFVVKAALTYATDSIKYRVYYDNDPNAQNTLLLGCEA